MVLVVLFLVFNVQMFMLDRDTALQDTVSQTQELQADTNAEQLTFANTAVNIAGNQVTISCEIKNTSPLSIQLVTLWVMDSQTNYKNTQISVPLNGGQTITFQRTVTLPQSPQSTPYFWFVTSRGNVFSSVAQAQGPEGQAGPTGPSGPAGQPGAQGPQGPEGTSGLISSIQMNWLQFRYYDFGITAPANLAVLPQAQSGCDIPQDHYVMVGAEFTNCDPNNRTITLTSDTYVWAVDPRDSTGNGALKTLLSWPIVSVQNNHLYTSFINQTLPVGVPVTVYFLDTHHLTPHTTSNPIPLNINLYGTTSSGSYGQNIPFVSVKFTQTMNLITFEVNPADAGTITPTGSSRYYQGASFDVSAQSNTGYKFLSWTANTTGLTISNPAQSSTSVVAGDSGTLTANFIATPSHFIDYANPLHDTAVLGVHSSFISMQAGPDETYDNITEGALYSWATPGAIGIWNGDPWIPGQDSNHKAISAIDGNTGTYWRYNSNIEHYICFDLGENYTVTQISLYQDPSTANVRFGYGSNAYIDVYVWPFDNNDIFSKGHVAVWSNAADSGGWVNLTLPSAQVGRYIKLWEHNAQSESSQRMYEFRFQYQTYSLNLEGQFRNVANYQYYTKLDIQTQNFNPTEAPVAVYCWNNGWTQLGTLSANTLNQFNVTLSSPSFDIKLVATAHGEPGPSSWQIDYIQLRAP